MHPNQINTHAENQNRAGQGKAVDGPGRQKRLNKPGQYGDGALEQRYRYGGKNTAFSHGGGHNQDNDKIQDGFRQKQGIISRQAVLDSAHHRHGADTHGKGRSDKGIQKPGVAFISGFSFQPGAKLLDPHFNI